MAANLFSSRRSRSRLTPYATINVTSLLDITMVLLISFMIIAPTLKNGITMDLPEVKDSTPLNAKESSVVLSVSKGAEAGSVLVTLDDEQVPIKNLRDRLEALRRSNPKVSLLVQGDKVVPWEEMAQVIGAVEASGIPGMSLVTIPPKKSD